jgi:hypothetical protein
MNRAGPRDPTDLPWILFAVLVCNRDAARRFRTVNIRGLRQDAAPVADAGASMIERKPAYRQRFAGSPEISGLRAIFDRFYDRRGAWSFRFTRRVLRIEDSLTLVDSFVRSRQGEPV